MRGFGAVVGLVVVWAGGCKASGEPVEGREDGSSQASGPAALDGFADLVARAPASERSLLAAAALGEGGGERLSAALMDVLAELPKVEASMRALVAMRGLSEPPLLTVLERVCQGKASEVLANTAMVAPDQKIAVVWDGCELGRFELVTAEEARTSGIGELLLGFVALEELRARGEPTASERALLRALIVGSRAP